VFWYNFIVLYKSRKALNFILIIWAFVCFAETRQRDVIVYGGTSVGVTAAIQAKKMGKSVILVSPDVHLGGLLSSGLGWTDSGNKETIGGLAREFYHRVWRHYQSVDSWCWQKKEEFGNRGQGVPAIDGEKRTMWVFEPHVAESIFESWVKEFDLEVIRNQWLDREKGVEIRDGYIRAINTLSGNRYEGKIFLDCTYEGDLMAAAGVSYIVGRESNEVYGERLNGVQLKMPRRHQFMPQVDPFIVEGDPASGLLARISDQQTGEEGTGDSKLQAYNFRLCLTQYEKNRVPFSKPEKYDPQQYEILLRALIEESSHIFTKFYPIPNAKTYTNNFGPFSTDNIGMNYRYSEASYEERSLIVEEQKTYQKGYFYFLCNDPRVPLEVREQIAKWGLAKDEFEDNEHWPHQIYVREARRMVSDFVITDLHVRGQVETPQPIGMGSRYMESSHLQRYGKKDRSGKSYDVNEGGVYMDSDAPYPLSYQCIVPRKEECGNLLVPVCVSSSHIAYASLRKESVFMILAQSAGTAACIAIDEGINVQQVSYEKLKRQLLEDGQILQLQENNLVATGLGINPNDLQGLVVDGTAIKLKGNWTQSASLRPFVGNGYFHDGNGGKGMKSAEFPFSPVKDGIYEVRISYIPSGNRAGAVKYSVTSEQGVEEKVVDQRKVVDLGEIWHSLGSFTFKAGKPYSVSLQNEGTQGYVVVDALQLLRLD
jgi:hypothetical protein